MSRKLLIISVALVSLSLIGGISMAKVNKEKRQPKEKKSKVEVLPAIEVKIEAPRGQQTTPINIQSYKYSPDPPEISESAPSDSVEEDKEAPVSNSSSTPSPPASPPQPPAVQYNQRNTVPSATVEIEP
jgi:outer membrane murein-binding lipoprotein Lpp